jgi:hypothetical protein
VSAGGGGSGEIVGSAREVVRGLDGFSVFSSDCPVSQRRLWGNSCFY